MGRENQNPHPELQVHLPGELIHILAAVGLGHPEIWVGGMVGMIFTNTPHLCCTSTGGDFLVHSSAIELK